MGQEFAIKDTQHKGSDFGTVACDFGQSLFHAAVESPINGVTQLVSEVTGKEIKPLAILGAPTPATSTADSYAQKIGGAIGMVLPYFLLSKGVGKAADGLAGTSLAKSLSMTPLLESSVARSGLSGAVFGGIFNPVSPDEKTPGWARLRNAASDGATFATMTVASESLAKYGIFKPGTSALANTVKDMGATMAAGVPAGIVSAETQSLLGQRRFATASELKQSALDFVTIGGALTALTHGVSATQGAWQSYRGGGVESAGSVEPVIFKPGNEGTTAEAATVEAAQLRPVLEYQVRPGQTDAAATAEAVNQSNDYKDLGHVRSRLQPGFQSVSGETRVGPDGNWNDPNRPGIAFDPPQDPVYRATAAEAHARFDQFKNDPERLAQELALFSKEKMVPEGWTSKHVDDADALFRSQNGNKRVLLGDYIQRAALSEGAGACQPQALLMKALGDEFGLDLSMSTGYLGKVPEGGFPTGFSPNHAFTELHVNGENLVFDPRNNILGTPIDQLANLTPVREFGAGEAAIAKPEQYNLKVGDSLSLNDLSWRLTDEKPGQPGNFVIASDGITSITADQLAAANPGHPIKIGEQYQIPEQYQSPGASSSSADGWTVQGTNHDGTIRLAKAAAVKLEVSPSQLAPENPQVARALGRGNEVLLGGSNDLGKVSRELSYIEHRLYEGGMLQADRTSFIDAVKAELRSADPTEYQALARKFGSSPYLNTLAPALKELLKLRATNPGINVDFALRTDIKPAEVQRYANLAVELDHVSELPSEYQPDMRRLLSDRLDIYNLKSKSSAADIEAMRTQTDNLADAFRGFWGNKTISPSIGKNVVKLLDMGADGDVRIAFSQIMAAGADSAAVKLYTDLTRHSLQIDMPASQKGGHIDEFKANKLVRDMAAKGEVGDGWVFVPSTNASLADSAGIDGAFINVKTRTWVPVDFAQDEKIVADKLRAGKGDWALAVNHPYGGGPFNNTEMAALLNHFLGADSYTPKLDLTQLEPPYGSGKMPFPSFRRVLTTSEADSLSADEGKPVFTTPAEITRFQEQIARNIHRVSAAQRRFYTEFGERAYHSLIPRRMETDLAQDVLPSMAAAVDVRVNPGAPNMTPLEISRGFTKFGDPYIEFPYNGQNSKVTAIRVYGDGNMVGVQPPEGGRYLVERELPLGSLRNNMDRATSLYAESDPRALRKLSATPAQFRFPGKTDEQVFSDYPAISVLANAIEHGGIVRAAATDSVALGKAKLDLDAQAKTDANLSPLSHAERMALARETVRLRQELNWPDLAPSQAKSLLQVKENLPQTATWDDIIAAEQNVREMNMDAGQAPTALIASKLRSFAPLMDIQTAKELAIWTAEFPVNEESMPALARLFAAKPAGAVAANFDSVYDFLTVAQTNGIALSPEEAVAKFKIVEQNREYNFYGGNVEMISKDVLGIK